VFVCLVCGQPQEKAMPPVAPGAAFYEKLLKPSGCRPFNLFAHLACIRWLEIFAFGIKKRNRMALAFSELINSGKPVLVDFHATWCGPCKTMAPVLQELKRELGDALTIIKVDVDKEPGLAQALSVQGVPTFVLFKNGNPLWRQSGAMSKAQLKNFLQPYL
jgi:thioredoxin 1